MSKYFLIAAALLLVGCTVVPVKQKFPEVPVELTTPCPDLKQTPPTDKLSDVLDVVVENYSMYHQCQEYQLRWNEWYEKQKKVYEDVR